MVIRLVAHGDLLFLDFPPQLSVHLLSHRGGGRHRVFPEDLTQVVKQFGGRQEYIGPARLGEVFQKEGGEVISLFRRLAEIFPGLLSILLDILPGEVVVVSKDGVKSYPPEEQVPSSLCVFEHIYFARPDSVIDGINVYQSRVEAGKRLAIDDDVEADMVIGVPDSALAAAMGYAQQSGIPYGDGLAKNRYVGRTFIQPEQGMRELGVRTKLNALTRNVRGKRLILVDDSIVRGTTSRKIVEMLRTAGAKEVHMRISSPSVLNPCYFGIDTATSEELIGHSRSVEEICRFIGADSLKFLSLPDLLKTVAGSGCQFCTGCFDGDYPIDPETGEMHGMEEEHDYV